MTPSDSLRDRIGAARVPDTELPSFETDAAPDTPLTLLVAWFDAAIAAGVVMPQAAALATSTAAGAPSVRTLLVKDVDDSAVWFASLSSAPKGRDLAENPRASLVLYWREQGRQVRVTGSVEPGPRAVSEVDFLQRHPNARAMVIAGRQSEPLPAPDEPETVAMLLDAANALIAREPDLVPEAWTAYRLVPSEVEFWQAEPKGGQVRLRYRLDGTGWSRELLWP